MDSVQHDDGQPDDEIRVLIVDDDKVFAEFLEFALNCEPGLTCVGRAGDADEAIDLFRRTRPAAVVMDLQPRRGRD